MGIEDVYGIIHKIADGFEDECMKGLETHSDIIVDAIREQLDAGIDGNGVALSPTYLEDDYFSSRETPWVRQDEETGKTYVGAQGYRDWKKEITPPEQGTMLGLPPRSADVPNLRINGKFHDEINAKRVKDSIIVDPGNGDGPEIIRKYSDSILDMSPTAIEYFNEKIMLPTIDMFFKKCGYK